MAPKDPFTETQSKWIKAVIPPFLAKVGALKPRVTGQPVSRDDADISSYVNNQWLAFEQKFTAELSATSVGASVWRTRFLAKFRNAKSQSLIKSGVKTSKATPFFRAVIEGPRGRDLFREHHSEEINLSVSLKRATSGEDSKSHAGLFQTELKQRWDALSEDEQKEWHEKASLASMSDATNLEKNQELFPDMITEALGSLIGSDAHQVGPATFLVLYGMRKSDNKLALGVVNVRGDGNDADFLAEYSDTSSVVIDRWNSYCATNLPTLGLPAFDHVAVTHGPDGRPVLPQFDAELEPAAVSRSLLTGFLEALWDYTFPIEAGVSTLPWDDITAHPSDYIKSSFIPSGITLSHPSSMRLSDFYAILDAIRTAAQTTATSSQPFITFHSQQDIQLAREHRVHASYENFDQPSPHAPADQATSVGGSSDPTPAVPPRAPTSPPKTPTTQQSSRLLSSPLSPVSPCAPPPTSSDASPPKTPPLQQPPRLASSPLSPASPHEPPLQTSSWGPKRKAKHVSTPEPSVATSMPPVAKRARKLTSEIPETSDPINPPRTTRARKPAERYSAAAPSVAAPKPKDAKKVKPSWEYVVLPEDSV
ncbi:hypothetical protein HWV62_31179 [Athelia sp. TMB]|nr:hypothetical protein HWV62_31179 [Athelia sp. TMB]